METPVDCDKLISVIYNTRPIWDKAHRAHSNRKLIERLWKDISATMAIDENTLRKKWKYLRDQFAVEIGKPPKRFVDEERRSKWPYFRQLLFLKDIVKPRVNPGNLSTLRAALTSNNSPLRQPPIMAVEDYICEPEVTIHELEVKEEDDVISDQLDDEESLDKKPTVTQTKLINEENDSQPKKKQKVSNFDDEFGQNEPENLTQSKDKDNKLKEEDDEDLLFFKSLLPHVKSISPENKLAFRGKILEVVDNFAYKTKQDTSAPLFINVNSVTSCSTAPSSDGVNTDFENSNN